MGIDSLLSELSQDNTFNADCVTFQILKNIKTSWGIYTWKHRRGLAAPN
jgi:hypothetical protein